MIQITPCPNHPTAPSAGETLLGKDVIQMQIAAADVVVAFSRRVIEFRTGESEKYD